MESPFPDAQHPAGPADPDPVPRARLVLLGMVVFMVGMAGVGLSLLMGRLDSALLFVGVPCLMAFVVGALRSEGGWPTLFQAVTVVLLLASALLHEGALCVLLASPVVYGFAALVYAAVRAGDPHHRALVLPVLALLSLEGALPGVRLHPEQHASATRVVAEDCTTFEDALARGPQIDPALDRGPLLDLAEYPTPVAATGDGLAPGDRWELAMPAGSISTSVVDAGPGRLRFDVLADSARTTRWVGLESGGLRWEQTGAGCTATLDVDYRRKLDPAFWFGPVTDVFMDAGASAFLASLD